MRLVKVAKSGATHSWEDMAILHADQHMHHSTSPAAVNFFSLGSEWTYFLASSFP